MNGIVIKTFVLNINSELDKCVNWSQLFIDLFFDMGLYTANDLDDKLKDVME